MRINTWMKKFMLQPLSKRVQGARKREEFLMMNYQCLEKFYCIMGKSLILIRLSSIMTMLPFLRLASICSKLAMRRATCSIGFRFFVLRKMIIEGNCSFLKAIIVPKSVSAETIILSCFWAKSNISSSEHLCILYLLHEWRHDHDFAIALKKQEKGRCRLKI